MPRLLEKAGAEKARDVIGNTASLQVRPFEFVRRPMLLNYSTLYRMSILRP